MEPEEAEVSLKYILKHAKRRGSGIFEIFDTEERTILWQAGGVGWSTKEKGVALQKSGQNDWQDVKYEGIKANALPCPEKSMKMPLPQQRSS